MSHRERVRTMMRAYGQNVPADMIMPDYYDRVRMIKLIMEEAQEFAAGCGIPVTFEINETGHKVPDIVEMLDGLADLSVVLHGATCGIGISDEQWEELLELVDNNNLGKVAGGHLRSDGKFEKPAGWKGPDIAGWLKEKGRSS